MDIIFRKYGNLQLVVRGRNTYYHKRYPEQTNYDGLQASGARENIARCDIRHLTHSF
jgi:hypothetical protein